MDQHIDGCRCHTCDAYRIAGLEDKVRRLQTSLQLAYNALRALAPDRRKGCLCNACLEDIAAEAPRKDTRESETCPSCAGKGASHPVQSGGGYGVCDWVPCERCHGSGKIAEAAKEERKLPAITFTFDERSLVDLDDLVAQGWLTPELRADFDRICKAAKEEL